jgi:hypothetical protein
VDTEKCKLRDDSVASGILTARPWPTTWGRRQETTSGDRQMVPE